MYGMTPIGVFFIAFFPLVINDQAPCQQLHFVLKLLDLNLGLLQFGTRDLILFPPAAPVLQAGFPHLLKAKRPSTNLLVAYLVFSCHFAIVFPAGNAFPHDLDAFLQRSFPSLLHVTSAS